jgi:hypothetical protein
MKLFEGKTKSERNKTIAAIGLGALSLIVLFFAFGRGMFGGSTTTATAKPSPSPKKSTTTAQSNPGKLEMPSQQDQILSMMVPIRYDGSIFDVPAPGRNIFAFYEPPKPTPWVPTPTPEKIIPLPTPTPTPDILLAAVNPQSVYAGSNGFRMEIAGDRFTPDTKIYFEQQEIPAKFINETRMTADIPAALIRSDGRRSIMAQTTDGLKRSFPMAFDIQPPPKPAFTYIGMIARTRGNNDTAYFQETGKPLPTGARLNDVVGGRFRVTSISAQESILEDVTLGFKHKLALQTPPPTASTSGPGMPGQPGRGFPSGGRQVYTPVNPTNPGPGATNSRIPGIPDNIPRYVPPQPASNRMPANNRPAGSPDEDDDGIDK